MYKIYNIVDNTNNNIYIGKTKVNINKRINNHLSSMKNEKLYCSSEIVLKNNNYTIKIIEDNLSEEDALHREIYYIQNTPNCINKMKYDFDKKEYDKKKRGNYYEEYRQNNKDKISQRKKIWYEKKVIKSVLDDIISQIEEVQ